MTTISLRGPADLLAVLPYHLGYQPSDSVLLVGLRERALGLVARLDLPPDDHVEEAVTCLVPPMVRERPDAVLVVAFESRAGQAATVTQALEAALVAAGLEVRDVLVVRDGRWYAPRCTAGCCPERGTPLPVPSDVPAVADFVGLEVVPLAGRDDLCVRLLPTDPALVATVRAELELLDLEGGADTGAAHAWRAHFAEALRLWALVLDTGPGRPPLEALRPGEIARLANPLRDLTFRDALIGWICPGFLPRAALPPGVVAALERVLPPPGWYDPGPGADRAAVVSERRLRSRLEYLCRSMPECDGAPLLTVLANLTWWAGDGAATRAALDRALDLEPGYRLAQLLARMVDLAIRPPHPDPPDLPLRLRPWSG